MTTYPIEGIDAAWSRPTPAQMVAAGKHFIVGYVSHDPAKNLIRDECLAYLDAGIGVGLVWETTTNRALAGTAAGRQDGQEARKQANALGFPAGKPIFTAVDFMASVAQLAGPIRNYLIAFAAAVGGTMLAGVYGGLDTVRYALNTGIVGWGWQTYAWSHGIWDERAYAQQYHNGVSISGHDTDLDRAVDFSAFWMKENDDMDLTPQNLADIAHAVWTTKNLPVSNPTETPGTALLESQNKSRDGLVQSTANGQSLTEIKAVLAGMGSGTGIDEATLRAMIAEEVGKALNATNLTYTTVLNQKPA